MNNSSPVSFALQHSSWQALQTDLLVMGGCGQEQMGFPSHVRLQTARPTRGGSLLLGGDEQEPQLLKMDAETLLPYVARALFCSGGTGVFSLLPDPWQHLTEFVNHRGTFWGSQGPSV